MASIHSLQGRKADVKIIELKSAGKRFQNSWIFRNLNLIIHHSEKIAVTGNNGSGKSTLLQVISGYQALTEGKINFSVADKEIETDDWYKQISCAAPYIDLPDELTLKENIRFFSTFKQLDINDVSEIAHVAGLSEHINKPLKFFSSGMKQRVRLTLAVLASVPVILLDEPCSNLDQAGVQWYHELINSYGSSKTIIVFSNHYPAEYVFCERITDLLQFKTA